MNHTRSNLIHPMPYPPESTRIQTQNTSVKRHTEPGATETKIYNGARLRIVPMGGGGRCKYGANKVRCDKPGTRRQRTERASMQRLYVREEPPFHQDNMHPEYLRCTRGVKQTQARKNKTNSESKIQKYCLESTKKESPKVRITKDTRNKKHDLPVTMRD
jgi:hypothetical protein